MDFVSFFRLLSSRDDDVVVLIMGGGCSLGKEGNNLMVPGREMKLLVDVRQDQRSLDRKKRGAKTGSMRRTRAESRARENRGDFWPEVWPSEGRYARCEI